MANKKKNKLKQPKLGFRKLKTLTPEQIANLLPGGRLDHGGHEAYTGDGGPQNVCLMEAVAFVTGEPHSDHPKCACPWLTSVGIGFNDSHEGFYGDSLNALVPAIPALVGSKTGSARVRFKRAKRAVQFLLEYYLNNKVEAGDTEERLVSELRLYEDIRTLDDAIVALSLLRYLGAYEDESYHILVDALSQLIKNWDSSGISAKAFGRIMPNGDLHDLLTDVEDQANFLTAIGFIRS